VNKGPLKFGEKMERGRAYPWTAQIY